MKKLSYVCLSLMLTIALAVTVFAVGDIVFAMSVSQENLSAGEEFTLTASCTANAEATSYGLMLKFDEDVFEVVSGNVTVADALVTSSGTGSARGFVFMFQEPTAYTGTVGTMVLKVKASAPAGNYTVSGVASAKNGAETLEAIDCLVTVTVSEESAVQESTANREPADIGEITEGTAIPDIGGPIIGEQPEETAPAMAVPVESAPSTGIESTLTIGAENASEDKTEKFPSWIFLATAGVIAAAGAAAYVIVKKKK